MSASSKLKALDLGPGSIDDAEFGTMGYDGLLALRDVLPQIVAVIEAAEDLLGPGAPSPGYIREGLGAALVALEEALQ